MTRFVLSFNAQQPGMEKLLPPSDSRQRPDLRNLEHGRSAEVHHFCNVRCSCDAQLAVCSSQTRGSAQTCVFWSTAAQLRYCFTCMHWFTAEALLLSPSIEPMAGQMTPCPRQVQQHPPRLLIKRRGALVWCCNCLNQSRLKPGQQERPLSADHA